MNPIFTRSRDLLDALKFRNYAVSFEPAFFVLATRMTQPIFESEPHSLVLDLEARQSQPDASSPALSILELVVNQAIGQAEPVAATHRLDEFHAGMLSVGDALRLWFGRLDREAAQRDFARWRKELTAILTRDTGTIDRLLNDQINAVLHHPKLQKLEASWRGLRMLVDNVDREESRHLRVRVLNVSWKEIQKDFERATEFDNSLLFRKIYEDEFGMPGGIPYGALVGDFEIHLRPSPEHPYDDLSMLGQLSGIAAAAFCPLVCGAHPSLFGVDDFYELQSTRDLAKGFQLNEFVKWRALRKTEDARFVGLALPRILMREPYRIHDTDGFCFREVVASPTGAKYLWGNASYAWASVLIRSYAETGWLADIRGVDRNRDGGGLLTSLPSVSFNTDRAGIATRSSTDLIITDRQEAEFSRLGFLPLCQCYDSEFCAYYGSQSIQEPVSYDSPVATANAHISTMLHYMLCVSRFAHYLKVMARDFVGSVTEPEDLRNRLDAWIKQYVTPDEGASPQAKARRPLREAEINVVRDPGKPGTMLCTFNLLPHYQLDELSAAIRLTTTTDRKN